MKSVIKKVFKILGILLLTIGIGVFVFLFIVSPGSTPQFKDDNGNILENSIAEMKHIPIGGIGQYVLVRGINKNNPILLILHGGPGQPETPMFRTHNNELEKHFTVVYWEQRGAGKSIVSDISKESFTIDRFIRDTHEVTKYLKDRFKMDKIFLLGHSWGSFLGIQVAHQYPDDYYAYIGTGQLGNVIKSEELAYDYTLKKAKEEKDTVIINALARVGGFTKRPIDKDLLNARRFVSVYGSLYKDNSPVDIFMKPLLFNKESTLGEKFTFARNGTNIEEFIVSPNFKLLKTVFNADLTKSVTDFKLPVYFMQGIDDYLSNYNVAREYFDVISAPKKEFITFDNSAHFPAFEEPKKFNDFLIHTVLKNNL